MDGRDAWEWDQELTPKEANPDGGEGGEGEEDGIEHPGTHLYQFSCVSTARPAVSCGARNATA
jgi:hypothetical protein